MFQEAIKTTPLTGNPADTVFSNINGSAFRRDMSFVATLRLALHGRIPDEESVRVFANSVTRSASRYRDSHDIEAAIGFKVDDISCGQLMINYMDVVANDAERAMEFIDANFTQSFSGWERMQKVTDLFRASFKISAFFNAEKKSTIVFVERMDMRIWHIIQTAIAGFLPWYFKGEKKENMTEVMELLYSLREKESAKYMECLAKFAGKFDFRTAKIKADLDGFEASALQSRLNAVEQRMNRLMREINDYYREISEKMREKYDLDIQFTGISEKISAGEKPTEIMDMFLSNKNLVLEYVDDSTVTFGVKGYMELYDADALKGAIRNKNSFIYQSRGSSIDKEDMAKLMSAIFLERKLKLRTCAVYYINLTGAFDGRGGFDYGSEYTGYFPNPHIDRYSCTGDYKRAVYECLENHNYLMAFENAAASARSINFNDAPVMNEFMHRMYNYSGVGFIEGPDGELMVPARAIAWLKEQEAA